MESTPSNAGKRSSSVPNGVTSKDVMDDQEVARVAMRIAMSTWSQLLVDAGTMTDQEILKKYIQICPYLPQNSPAILAALEGIDRSLGNDSSLPESFHVPSSVKDSDDSLDPAVVPLVPIEPKSRAGQMIRLLLLDIPMFLLLALYMSLVWIQHIHDTYWVHEMKAVLFTPERAEQDITYYRRPCFVDDLTTGNSNDLFLSPNATAQEAYDHQLLHGFSIFPRVLTEDTATALRDYVVSRNRDLSDEDSIFVIENENRYSFGLGTEHPAVAAAVLELASHERLVPALEKILGPNPALIEMTAITSSYGAVNQHWHDDIIAEGSVIQYARTFGPSFSVFVQLQNTTKKMGATAACPGTHMCATGPLTQACEAEGFQVVNDEGYWGVGDALLMNMNSWHRGAAHVDPDAPDRVMLILTFVPKPRSKAESRQMSQGITFSLRWDMWGHTLKDLATASTSMVEPWSTLRALGLYKPRDADWGIDYTTGSIMRMSNGDNGFRRDELDTFMKRGGFHWLPRLLHGDYGEDDSWYEFLQNTLLRCRIAAGLTTAVAVGFYAVVALILVVTTPGKSSIIRRYGRSLLPLLASYVIVSILFALANRRVDQSEWAMDVTAGRLYSSVFENQEMFSLSMGHNPTTFPHRNDVLIDTRYSGRDLALFNDFIANHPGNRIFQDLVKAGANGYREYPEMFREATARFILSAIKNEQGRFLYQDPYAAWRLVSDEEAVSFIEYELVFESLPAMQAFAEEISFLISEYKYGRLRDTVMAQKYSVPYLQHILVRLVNAVLVQGAKPDPAPLDLKSKKIRPTTVLSPGLYQKPVYTSNAHRPHRVYKLNVGNEPKEPRKNAWLKAGDVVDRKFREDNGVYRWYKAIITHVSASGNYDVIYPDGETDVAKSIHLRKFIPYAENEHVEALIDDNFVPGVVTKIYQQEGSVDVMVAQTKSIVTVNVLDIRRVI